MTPLESDTRSTQLRGVGFMILTALSFSGLAFFIRFVSPEIPAIESFFVRSFSNSILFILFALQRQISIFGKHRRDLTVRGVSGSIAGLAFFWGLTVVPLSEASALFRTAALFMPFLALLLLREKLSLTRSLAAFTGFIGACLILKPGFASGLSGIGPWVLLGGAFFNALAMVTLRSLTKREHSLTILLAFSLWASLLSLIFGYQSFVWPDERQWWGLLALSSFGLLGQIFQVLAYKYAEATLVTPINYFEIFFLGVLGWLFLDQHPDLISIMGMVLITASGIAIVGVSRSAAKKAVLAAE